MQLKGLSLSVIKEDIKNKFNHLTLRESDIHLEYDVKGRATGIGFVAFLSSADQDKAITLDGTMIGSKMVRITKGRQSDINELEQRRQDMLAKAAEMDIFDMSESQFPKQSDTKSAPVTPTVQSAQPNSSVSSAQPNTRENGIPVAGDSTNSDNKTVSGQQSYLCAQVQGVPPYAGISEIQQFFGGAEITHRSVQFVKDSFGRNLGEVFIEFTSRADCEKALQKNGQSMGNEPLVIKGIDRAEMISLVRQTVPPLVKRTPGSGPQPLHMQRPVFHVQLTNLPFDVAPRDVGIFCREYRPIEGSAVIMGKDLNGGIAKIAFKSKEEADLAIRNLNRRLVFGRQIFLQPF